MGLFLQCGPNSALKGHYSELKRMVISLLMGFEQGKRFEFIPIR